MSATRRVTLMLAVGALIAIASLSPANATPTFGAPVKLSQSTGFEPGIDIAPDGSIIVNEPEGTPSNHTALWRSADGGASFTKLSIPTPFNHFLGGGDGDVSVGHTGNIYMADLYLASSSFFRSSDNGATWSFGEPVSQMPGDRQWLATGPTTLLGDTVYIASNLEGLPTIGRSIDSGTSWTWESTGTNSGAPGQLVADDAGFVAYPYDNGIIQIATSKDQATTWSQAQVADATSTNILSLAKDGSNLYVVFEDDADWAIKVARSTDLGATWADPVTISTGGTNIMPWVAARAGKVAVSWYAADTAKPMDMGSVPTSTQWFLHYSESTDGVNFSAPVEPWSKPVKTGIICAHLGCADADRALGDFQQVAIDANGASLISFSSHVSGNPQGTLVIKQS